MIETQLCKTCYTFKPIAEFYVDKTKKNRCSSKCKLCMSSYHKSRKDRKNKLAKERRSGLRVKYINNDTEKYCNKCRQYKLFNCFNKDKYSSDKLQSRCKE